MLTFVIVLAVVAVLSVIGTVAYAATARRRAAQPPAQAFVQQTLRPYNPGRELIEHMQEIGKEHAGIRISAKLGDQAAGEFMKNIAAAFAEPTPAASTPPQAPK